MDAPKETLLLGGNVNQVTLIENTVRRMPTIASETIERLLHYSTVAALPWIPGHLGFDNKGRECLQFLPGAVPHDEADWLWHESVLIQVASRLREWHDATQGFDRTNTNWNLAPSSPDEVICHNDFAPYNLVFENKHIVGLIDFDTCAPGPRIWDIAYAAYKIVPLRPDISWSGSNNPPGGPQMAVQMSRLELFLESYAGEDRCLKYSVENTVATASKRLLALADWTGKFARNTSNEKLIAHEAVYRCHAQWLKGLEF